MNGPIRSLIIKEWHEQKWRCASLSAIGLSVVVFTMLREPEVVLGGGISAIYFQAFLGTIFIAMGAAAGERSAGTLELLRALPIHLRGISLIKLLSGILTCLIPIFLVLLVTAIWLTAVHLLAAQGHEASASLIKFRIGMYADIDEFIKLSLTGVASCISICLWVIAAGFNERTELHAGLRGIGVLIGWALVLILTQWLVYVTTDPSDPGYSHLLALVVGTSPFGPYILLTENYQYTWPVITAHVATGGLLITWIVWRYGKLRPNDNTSPTNMPSGHAGGRLGRPRRSAITAIAWKQWRDTLPMMLIGIAIIVFIVSQTYGEYAFRTIHQTRLDWIDRTVAETSRAIGIVLALLIGVGTFVGDYQPGALTFWRSRPISPRLWFWNKYLTGLIIVEFSMIAPWLMTHLVIHEHDLTGFGASYLAAVVILYWFVFNASVWMACLLRHNVYAGVMAAGITCLVLVPPTIEPLLSPFSVEMVQAEHNYPSMPVWFIGYYLPYLIWMMPPTLLALWLATRAARRESAFVIER